MPSDQEIEAKFWKALRSDRTIMLGLDGVEDGHARPMTALVDGDENHGPLYVFASKDNTLIDLLARNDRAIATFVSKGHDLYATVHGSIRLDTDGSTIDRLWNPYVAAWFEGGRDDPKLALLRLDPERAEIWLDGSSVVAGVKALLGRDPKKDYQGKVAEVELS